MEQEEIWKDIEGYEGLYQVSNMGRVRSLDRIDCRGQFRKGKIFENDVKKSGYCHIDLWKNGKYKFFTIHRLVAQAFIQNDDPEHKTQVNHINENKQDNRVCNLEWTSCITNQNHGTRNERISKTKTNGKRAKKIYQYTRDGEFIKEWPCSYEVERQLGYCSAHIRHCCCGDMKTYKNCMWKYACDVDKEKGAA